MLLRLSDGQMIVSPFKLPFRMSYIHNVKIVSKTKALLRDGSLVVPSFGCVDDETCLPLWKSASTTSLTETERLRAL